MKLLVIGENCIDEFFYGDALRLAPEAPAPVFVPSYSISNQGMAANVLENLKSLGAEVTFHTNKNKITKSRYVDDKTNHLLLRIDVGDKDTRQMDSLSEEYLNCFDAIVISDYNKGFITENDIFSICNMHNNVFIDTKKPITVSFKLAKYIKINKHEYDVSKKTIENDEILKSKVIVTLGKNGCSLNDKIYPVEEVAVKDQVGAGDSFFAGLVYKYVETSDIDKAIIFANECATKVVTRRGVSVI